MRKAAPLQHGYTYIELMVVVVILAVMATMVFLLVNPINDIQDSRAASAKASLNAIVKAANLSIGDLQFTGAATWPPTQTHGIPNQFLKYLDAGVTNRPAFPNSYYEWDNWQNQTCWNGTPGGVQISLRNVNGYNGHNNYVLYDVVSGPGIPDCTDNSIHGECINCTSVNL